MSAFIDGSNGITFPDGSVLSSSPNGFKNRIINGDNTVDQINAGAVQTIVAAAARAPIVDMFYAYCTGANVTGQQITATDGTKRYRYTGAASVTAINHDTAISAANSRDMAGKTVTLSAKLSNSLLTSVTWAAYYANTTEAFGTVASPTRTQIATGTFTVSSVEATYAASFAVPAAATTGIEIVLSVGAQISGTWTIGDMQLELGSIPATSIVVDKIEEQVQFARCQRYYEPITPSGNARLFRWYGPGGAGEVRSPFPFQVQKRAIPIIINATPDFASNCSATIQDVTAYGYSVVMLSTSLGVGTFGWLSTTTAFSARLMA